MSLSTGLKGSLSIVVLSCGLAGQSMAPERKAQANRITSEHDPKVRIELPKTVQYAGGDRWILYDIADCELHAFVEADSKKNVQRLYWVQFESYVPSKPELHYTYDSPRHTKLSGWDFYVDTWVRPSNAKMRPGSDLEHMQALVRGKGYKFPGAMMSLRLVHLLDEEKRKELMIIYSEDAASSGIDAAALEKDARWPGIEKGLIERVKNTLLLTSDPR